LTIREDVMSETRRKNDRSSGFKSVKQVGLAVSIGFPLLVMGVLALAVFLVSWVGTATALWIIAGVVLATGLAAAASGRVI
jgi:Flp pilus assembly protein TadB